MRDMNPDSAEATNGSSRWSPETELLRPAPRPARRRRFPRFDNRPGTGFGCFEVIFGVAAVFVWLSFFSTLFILTAGEWTQGTVTHKTVRKGSKTTTYTVFYWWGRDYRDSEEINASSYEGWRVGDRFGIKTLGREREGGRAPSHLPFLTRFASVYWPQFDWLFMLVWATFVSLFVCAGFYQRFIEPRRQRFLVAQGVPVEGVLGTVTRHKNGSRSLSYSWRGADGVEQSATLLIAQSHTPRVGSAATVLLSPRDPHSSTLYAFCLYEVAA